MRDPQNFLTPDTMEKLYGYTCAQSKAIACEVNALIREALGPKVICRLRNGKWICEEVVTRREQGIHEAHLFCVREMGE